MKDFLRKNGPWVGLLLLVLIVTVLTHVIADSPFLSSRNLTNLFRQTAINGVLAMGMTFVILTGGIDLSIGSLVAFVSIVIGMSQVHWGWANLGAMGAFQSTLLGLLLGLFGGLVTGGLISWLRIPPFVISLGMMVILRGLALILSDGSGISPMGESLRSLSEGYLEGALNYIFLLILILALIFQFRKKPINMIFPFVLFGALAFAFTDYRGFPIPVLILFIVLGISGFILTKTVFGRCVFAVGSNEQAAYFSGVPIGKVKWLVYAIMGLLSGLGAVLLTSRLNSAVPTSGQLFELDAIAAVVIGGTSLKGGSGSVLGSFVGALMIGTLNNGMDMLGVPSFYQMVFKGLIIIIAVGLDRGQRES